MIGVFYCSFVVAFLFVLLVNDLAVAEHDVNRDDKHLHHRSFLVKDKKGGQGKEGHKRSLTFELLGMHALHNGIGFGAGGGFDRGFGGFGGGGGGGGGGGLGVGGRIGVTSCGIGVGLGGNNGGSGNNGAANGANAGSGGGGVGG